MSRTRRRPNLLMMTPFVVFLLVGGYGSTSAQEPPQAQPDSSEELDEFFQRVAGKRRGPFAGRSKRHTRNQEGRVSQLNLKRVKNLKPADFQLIGGLERLEVLDLSGSNVRGEDLKQLADLKQLRELSLWDTDITSAALRHLSELRTLQRLNIGDTSVTDDGLTHLRNLRELHHLVLTRSKVSDAGLANLTPLKANLESIKLGETLVSDACVEQLEKFSKLHGVTLEQTKVSQRGLDLLAQLPRFVWISTPENVAGELARRMEQGDFHGVDDMLAVGLFLPTKGKFELLSLAPQEKNKKDLRLNRQRFLLEMIWTNERKKENVLYATIAVDRGSIGVREMGIRQE